MKKLKNWTAVFLTALAIAVLLLVGLGQIVNRGGASDALAYTNSETAGDNDSYLPIVSAPQTQSDTGPFEFKYVEVDGGISGDVKMVGDLDGDTFPDLVLGGITDEKLNWYHYPSWQKTVIATPSREFSTDGALGDVDGDGDLDIVVPDGGSGDNLVWFENPRPGGDPFSGNQWTRHTIGSIGDWGKDVHVADYDKNGRLDVATRNSNEAMIFFQTGANTWTKMNFSSVSAGEEGMASGDIDKDTNVDLVLQGKWLHNPGGDSARTASNWSEHTIGSAHPEFKALVVDLNKDGKMDVLFSSSEGTADVDWWTPDTTDPTGSWSKKTILPSINRAHTLQAADMDLDGDMDVVLAQMHTSSEQEIMIMLNTDGKATTWEKKLVDTGGLHNGVVADIGNDGDYDIYGANWTGNLPVKLYENQISSGPISLDNWTYKKVTDQHVRSFGLDFGDVNGDTLNDIISGQYWYKNPGGDLLGNWTQSQFPSDMHVFRMMDVDDDAFTDLIAQKLNPGSDISLYWLEATNSGGTSWNSVLIGSVNEASHLLLGAQGYRVGQVEAGGKPEVLISSGNGIYYFRVPGNPSAGNWPRVHVNANPSDEGFALGYIDADSNLDIAATTGRSNGVEWYKNPGNGVGSWTAYQIGEFPSDTVFPDRTELADVNNDGKLDIVSTEENDGSSKNAEIFWWQQPADPTAANWTRHLIVTQYSTNSLDAADMDRDGDDDIVLAEHKPENGDLKLSIWENDGSGGLSEHAVDTGKESHLGAQLADLDGDGDLDIVSIAYDAPLDVHLWRNGPSAGATAAVTPADQEASGQEPDVSGQEQDVNDNEVSEALPTSEPLAVPVPTSGRVVDGQQVLYRFDEAGGSEVKDVSGAGNPLELVIDNEEAVSWIDDGGLAIRGPTIISSGEAATKVFDASQSTNEITIEAWIASQSEEQDGPARMVTSSLDPFNRNFTLGQEFGAYDVRLRTEETSENGVPSLSTGSDAVSTNMTHLVYTRDASGNAFIYLDGAESSSWQIGGDLSGWDSDYPLILANELTEDRPWLGTYYLVAIYNRALSPAEVQHNFASGPDAAVASPAPAVVDSESTNTDSSGSEADAGGQPTSNSETSSGDQTAAEEQDQVATPVNGSQRAGPPTTLIIGGVLLVLAIGIAIGVFAARSRRPGA